MNEPAGAGARIVVVDDEPAIRRLLLANLSARGYEVVAVETGEEALERLDVDAPDLVILDLMLPGLSGLDVCRGLRAASSVPILVLSARGEEGTKVQALDLGADDYLTKPFGVDELLARVRALLRRPAPVESVTHVVRAGALVLDPWTREVWRDDAPLDLTPREFDLLAYLMQHAHTVVPHRALLAAVWGPAYAGETQYLRVFINRLRRKIEEDPAHPRHIRTEPGVGYRFVMT
jgi:two-component system KDP operon response regulator KdpE